MSKPSDMITFIECLLNVSLFNLDSNPASAGKEGSQKPNDEFKFAFSNTLASWHLSPDRSIFKAQLLST